MYQENNLLNAVKAILSDRKRRADRASSSSNNSASEVDSSLLSEAGGDTPNRLGTPHHQVSKV